MDSPKTSKPLVNRLLIHAIGATLLLRLIINNLFPDNFVFIQERLGDLIIAGLIILILLGLGIYNLITKKTIQKSFLDLPLLLLFVFLSLSLCYPADPSSSINYYLNMTSAICLFFVVKESIRQKEDLHDHFVYLLLITAVLLFFGFWEMVKITYDGQYNSIFLNAPGPIKRIGSVFGLPNVFAGILILIMPIIGSVLFFAKKSWQKISLTIVLFGCAILFINTYSFLTTLGLLISSLIFILLLNKLRKIHYLPWIILGIGSIAIGIYLLRSGNFSTSARFSYLQSAFSLLMIHPIKGWGLNNFEFISRQFVHNPSGFTGYVHNSYLQLWLEAGLFAFISYLVIFKRLLSQSLKVITNTNLTPYKPILLGLSWGIFAYVIDNLTNFTMLRPICFLFGWWAMAGFTSVLYLSSNISSAYYSLTISRIIYLIKLPILNLLLIIILNISFGLISYQQGLEAFNKKQFSIAFAQFSNSSAIDPYEFRYPSAIGSVYIQLYFHTRDKKFLNNAENYFLKASKLNPYDHKTYFILHNIAKEKKDLLAADLYLAKAKQVSPLNYSKFK